MKDTSMSQYHRQKVLNILRCQKLATLATISHTNVVPESALIAFAEDEELCLYFQTGRHTRKSINLSANPHVALVIGLNLADMVTIQYEGWVRQLSDPIELAACKQRFVAKDSPTTAEYFNHPLATFFKVTPTWIGYSDYSKKQPEIIEIKDFAQLTFTTLPAKNRQ